MPVRTDRSSTALRGDRQSDAVIYSFTDGETDVTQRNLVNYAAPWRLLLDCRSWDGLASVHYLLQPGLDFIDAFLMSRCRWIAVQPICLSRVRRIEDGCD
jgi:hypothetical protein